MRILILAVIALHLVSAEAGLREHWKHFCSSYIITNAPWWANEQYAEIIKELHQHHPDPQDYIDSLIDRYRLHGGQAYWLSHNTKPSPHERLRLSSHRVYLDWLGSELREMLPQASGDRVEKVLNALHDYEEYESHRQAK